MGRAAIGRGVARGGQDEVEGVGVASHDHAVEGRGEREVADPRLDPLRLARGHGQVGLGDRDVDLGLGERGLFGEQLRLRLHDGRLRRVPRGDGSTSTGWSTRGGSGGRPRPGYLVREPLDLRVPAVDLGLVLVQDRLGLGEARVGRLDVGVGHLHQLAGQLDPFLIELDGRLLRPEILDQLGHEELGEHVALLYLVADVHDPLLDIAGQLRIDRRPLVTPR